MSAAATAVAASPTAASVERVSDSADAHLIEDLGASLPHLECLGLTLTGRGGPRSRHNEGDPAERQRLEDRRPLVVSRGAGGGGEGARDVEDDEPGEDHASDERGGETAGAREVHADAAGDEGHGGEVGPEERAGDPGGDEGGDGGGEEEVLDAAHDQEGAEG